jgi:hypothetical protein
VATFAIIISVRRSDMSCFDEFDEIYDDEFDDNDDDFYFQCEDDYWNDDFYDWEEYVD